VAPPSRVAEEFTSSLRFDRRLGPMICARRGRHCQMLARQSIIPKKDADKILAGPGQIRVEPPTASAFFLPRRHPQRHRAVADGDRRPGGAAAHCA
jgi:argininosuccinate lyase